MANKEIEKFVIFDTDVGTGINLFTFESQPLIDS